MILKIRDANRTDETDILVWRNDIHTRRNSEYSLPISAEQHRNWFMSMMTSEESTLFMGELGGQKIGVCYFVVTDADTAIVSINLNPKMRGQGLGQHLLYTSIEEFLKTWDGNLIARIKPGNIASVRCFTKTGFKAIEATSDINIYSLGSSKK